MARPEPAIGAATYVIGADGRVALAYVDPEYRNRPEPAEVVARFAPWRPGLRDERRRPVIGDSRKIAAHLDARYP